MDHKCRAGRGRGGHGRLRRWGRRRLRAGRGLGWRGGGVRGGRFRRFGGRFRRRLGCCLGCRLRGRGLGGHGFRGRLGSRVRRGFGGFRSRFRRGVGHFGLDHDFFRRRRVRVSRGSHGGQLGQGGQIVRREHCAGRACRHTAGQKHSQQTFSHMLFLLTQSPMGVVPHRDRFGVYSPRPAKGVEVRGCAKGYIFQQKEKAPAKTGRCSGKLCSFYAWSYLLGTARREIVRSKVLYAVR